MKNIPEEAKELLVSASRNADRLMTLTNSLLDIKKMETCNQNMRWGKVYLADIIQRVIDGIMLQAKAKSLKLTSQLCGRSESCIEGDPEKLEEMVNNLMMNAIKYTFAGGVHITLDKPKKENKVVMVIWDTGVGIKSEEQMKIFENNYRSNSPQVVKTTGSGMV